MKFIFFAIIAWLSIAYAKAQPGCTDPQALNFDPTATVNDGSCTYPPTTYSPELIAELPSELAEASGMEFFDHQLWLHEDGGAGPLLQTVDTVTAAIQVSYSLPLLENTDWEDLAEDAENLYIGDFGNNSGDRTNLRIFKVNKTALQVAGTVTAEVIEFSFSDQTDFTPAYHATNFDCEAMVVIGDSLHIFSKRWLDKTTHHYVLPTAPGSYVAPLRDSFNIGLLATAADMSADGVVALLGYDLSTSEVAMWLFWDFAGGAVFSGNKRKISLGSALSLSQAEGLAFSTATEGLICSERFSVLPQKLHRFDIRQWLENPSPALEAELEPSISLSPNPFSDFLIVDFQVVGGGDGQFSLVGTDGQTWRSGELRSGKNTISTEDLPAGTYFLWVKNEDGNVVRKVMKS